MDLKKLILKYSLQNAVKYGGKANPGAVMGKVLMENPKLKSKAKEIQKQVLEIIKEVNSKKPEQQKKELESLAPELLEKKEKKERDIFAFLGIKGKVTTAFPPEPSKYPHIGHAKAILLNYELAKRFKGKFVLRFEDTNPALAQKDFYDIHLNDYKWLGIKADELDYASNHMEEFYNQAEKLIKDKQAYICTCSQDEIGKGRRTGKPCKCRSKDVKKNLELWKRMPVMNDGDANLRLKIDLKHQNSAMRDPVIMRIIKDEHPLQKKKFAVWPTYDFENAVMDGIEKITHRLRSKEFELRNELQRYIQKLLGFKETQIFEFARFNLEGVESSGRIIREKIKNKELIDWDDPSLTTLAALRRRGFTPDAIKNFVLGTGITKAESVLTWDDLIVHNKRILDFRCNRYFFVQEPVKINIKNAPSQDVKLKLHPEDEKRGFRRLKTGKEFYITKNDFKSLKKGKLYRLMDCLNFKDLVFDSKEHEKYKKKGEKIIHWLPVQKDLAEVEVLMPDKTVSKGLAEPLVKKLKKGDIIQFERFGFCRLDEIKKNKYVFWFTHK